MRYHRVVGGMHGQAPQRPARPPPSRRRHILRLFGWNALILFVLLALAAGGAEAYLRLSGSASGEATVLPIRLMPGVGVVLRPHAEFVHTNERDFHQVPRTNSQGWLDREPPSPERAAESCHATLIGDSYVMALEVPIADKVQVRLEEMAARELPALDVTTSAFGFQDTAQINQLAFYDAWARTLSPDIVVLVASHNDFEGNSLPLRSWSLGFHPDHPSHVYARRGADGELEFAPPAGSLEELRAHRIPPVTPVEPAPRVETALRTRSHLADWFWRTLEDRGRQSRRSRERLARAEWLSAHPAHAAFMEGWDPGRAFQRGIFLGENPPPVWREALEVMGFALEQFLARAERDGAELVILATHRLGGAGSPYFELLREIAAGIGGGDSRHQPVRPHHRHGRRGRGRAIRARHPLDSRWPSLGGGGHP